MLGVLSVSADASASLSRWLMFYRPTGPLSGVSSLAILAWLVTWFALAKRWKARSFSASKVTALSCVLLLLALILTFVPALARF